MVMDFCGIQLPGFVIYGYGERPHGGIRLEPEGSTRCFPHVHHGGLRYGNDLQSRGFSSRYGFVRRQEPVLIKRIYQCTLEIECEPEVDQRQVLCAVVQRFKKAEVPANFPWDDM
jgi:hypothetical protein